MDSTEELLLKNVKLIDCFAKESQVFDQIGIHLTAESGAIFVEGMLTAGDAYFGSGIIMMKCLEEMKSFFWMLWVSLWLT